MSATTSPSNYETWGASGRQGVDLGPGGGARSAPEAAEGLSQGDALQAARRRQDADRAPPTGRPPEAHRDHRSHADDAGEEVPALDEGIGPGPDVEVEGPQEHEGQEAQRRQEQDDEGGTAAAAAKEVVQFEVEVSSR